MSHLAELDQVDRLILEVIQADNTLSNVEIGKRAGVSAPTVTARIKRLRELGIIVANRAIVAPSKVGYDLKCIIHINLQTHTKEDVYTFRDEVANMPEVLSAYQITGSFDYVLMVIVKNQGDLSRFLMEKLTPFECVARIETSVVLNEVKVSTVIPIDRTPT